MMSNRYTSRRPSLQGTRQVEDAGLPSVLTWCFAGMAVLGAVLPVVAWAGQVTVTHISGYPNSRTVGENPPAAIDGNVHTYTWTTNPNNTADPSYLQTGFTATAVNRIRLWKQRHPGGGNFSKNLVIEYTTDTTMPLESRTWQAVSHLATGYAGETLRATAVNVDGTVTEDIHDSPDPSEAWGGNNDGWASLTFDSVTATGVRIAFRNPHPLYSFCNGITNDQTCNHYRVGEIQVWGPDAPSDAIAPSTTAVAVPAANSAGWTNSDVTVTLTATDNSGGSGVQKITYYTSGAQVAGPIDVPGASAPIPITREGTTVVSYYATDKSGNAEPLDMLTIKLDKTAPALSGLPTGCLLWPPNNKMVQIATIGGSDANGVSVSVAVSSNEPSSPPQQDIVVSGPASGPKTVQVRAQRSGSGTGRVYTILASATDIAGNTTASSATCTVPHDQRN